MKIILSILIAFFLFEGPEWTVNIYQPSFAHIIFYTGDSIRYVEFFDKNQKIVRADTMQNINSIKTCIAYMAYHVRGISPENLNSYSHIHLYSCVRIDSMRWEMRNEDGKTTKIIEDRSLETGRDSTQVEDPNNPGSYYSVQYHFYGVKEIK